jgi:hypothetical protein
MMEAVNMSEASLNFLLDTRFNFPEDSHLRNNTVRCSENDPKPQVQNAQSLTVKPYGTYSYHLALKLQSARRND